MAVNSQTSLVDFLAELGLSFPDSADYQNLEKAEKAVTAFIADADLSLDTKLAQTLWVNGQQHLSARQCHKPLLEKIREHQKGNTAGADGLLLAQALLARSLMSGEVALLPQELLQPLDGAISLPEKLVGLHEQVARSQAENAAASTGEADDETGDEDETEQAEENRRQIDLLWWGEAMFSYRRRKRFASLPPIEAAFFLALELSERAPLNTPVQALESYLVERLKHLQRDGHLKSDEKKHFSDWLKALGEAVELRTAYDADPKLDAVVKSDAWLLPLSYFRAESLVSSPAKAINGLESKTGYKPDFELSLEQLACQCLRELLLNRRFKEASAQGAAS